MDQSAEQLLEELDKLAGFDVLRLKAVEDAFSKVTALLQAELLALESTSAYLERKRTMAAVAEFRKVEAELSRLTKERDEARKALENDDLLEAMKAIEHALHDDKGNYFKLRAYLDKHGMYHGNLNGEAVILEVAEKAIRVRGAPPRKG